MALCIVCGSVYLGRSQQVLASGSACFGAFTQNNGALRESERQMPQTLAVKVSNTTSSYLSQTY